jgi:hypothetical protein
MRDFDELNGHGFAGYGLTSKLLVGESVVISILYPWILSSTVPQKANVRGKWIDEDNWTDTNIWYD